MELLGDHETVAPRLIDVELMEKEAPSVFKSLMESVEVFWNLGVVHGDLSAYNILWWNSKPYVIDFPQSIDVRTHPNAREILERDLQNLTMYFGKYMIVNLEQVKNRFR